MQRRDAGFTLLEVLIAFSIFAIVLMVIYDSLATSLQGEAEARRVLAMTEIARSVLSEVGHSIDLAEGEYSGREGDQTDWTLTIRPEMPPAENVLNGQIVQLFRVDLTLRDTDGNISGFSRLMLGGIDE